MSAAPFSITIAESVGVAIAEIGGTCYEGPEDPEAALEPLMQRAAACGWRVAVGLGGVTFLNSRGISVLLNLRSACERHRGCFVMYELFEAAEHALVTLRLMPILKIASSRDQAVRLCLEHRAGGTRDGPATAPPPGASHHRPPRLAVMISGAGRTMLNLADRVADGRLGAQIALVIASRECPGAAAARERGLEVLVMPGRIPARELGALLRERSIDYVTLAGYLQLVDVPREYRGRMVNIHPALLPGFGGQGMYGSRVHEAVLASGATESGCTVHLVDDRYDTGDVLLQRRCPVLPGDTPESLGGRVFQLELEAYPAALAALFDRAAAPSSPNIGV